MSQIQLFEKYSAVPFNHGTLLSVLKEYKRPNDKISRMLSENQLVKIKRGLYVLGENFRSEQISPPLVANLIYGPSYVSLDYALAYYGLIPETVFEVSSVTTGRARFYDSALGRFSYLHSYQKLYSIGIQLETNPDGSSFMIASPTKALCDKIIFTKKLNATSVQSMNDFLFEDLRLELTALTEFEIPIIEKCIVAGYKVKQLKALRKLIGNIK